MNKGKETQENQEESAQDLPFAPPELDYLSERYVLEIPLSDEHFGDPWQLRVYATKMMQQELGDEAEVTALKVKKPRLVAKSKAKLLKREPTARLYLTVKF